MNRFSSGNCMKEKKIFTIPNCLSFCRVLMIPFLLLSIVRGDRVGAFTVLALSAVTDIADGFIARTFDMVSDVGKVLDPLADKITQGALILTLALRFPPLFFLFGLLVLREAAMGTVGTLMFRKTGKVSSSRWYGKLATVLVYMTAAVILVFPDLPTAFFHSLVSVSGAAVILSMILYLVRFSKMMKE